MDLTSKKTIKNLLSKYKIKPSKIMGQNFLVSRAVLQKIIGAADLKPSDIILEVGPGIGTLTQELAKKVEKVIAVEKDRQMCEILKETLRDYKNVEIVNDDILKIRTLENYLKIKNFKVVANIPYYLTSPLIRKLLEAEHKPELIVLTIQKEVAQRTCAKPPEMSILAVSVQFYADAEIISYVSKNYFWPSPKVDSAIIKIIPRESPAFAEKEAFLKIVKAGFSQPRKQISGNLAKALKLDKEKINNWLLKNNIGPKQRAETLSIEDWWNLTSTFQ